jgi:hypothetical protein
MSLGPAPPVCVYCLAAPGVTRDHVPPKSFFSAPRPRNLITVPACLKCNQRTGKDEDYFLATLMFSEAGITQVGRQLWNERLRSMYARNIGLRGRIARSLRHGHVSTPAGILLGRRMAIEYDPQRLEAIAAKVVRGLYFFERGAPLPGDAELYCLFLRERGHFRAVEGHNHLLRPGSLQWGGTFQYRCGFVPGNPVGSMWLLWFWRTHIFWIVTSQQHTAAPIQ